jgi:hypothetical protein
VSTRSSRCAESAGERVAGGETDVVQVAHNDTVGGEQALLGVRDAVCGTAFADERLNVAVLPAERVELQVRRYDGHSRVVRGERTAEVSP